MIWLWSHVHWISLQKASQVAAVKGKKVSEYKPQYVATVYQKKKKKEEEAEGERRKEETWKTNKKKAKKQSLASLENWLGSTTWR